MKQHHHPEGLQMINRIRSPVVAFELGKLEVWRDRFLHDHLGEGRVSTNILTISGGRMAEFFDSDRKSTRLNSSHSGESRMPSSA